MQNSLGAKVDKETKAEKKGKTELPIYQPKLPYPAKVKKDQQEWQYRKFLNVFKTLHINVPFVEELSQLLRYAKFLK